MAIVNICLGISGRFSCIKTFKQQEEEYRNVYKIIISSLYSRPKIPFTFYFSGLLLEWLEKNHPEFCMLLEEMVARKQIEVLGGGYYEPLFPFIPPSDRVGQIELMTTALRKIAGKRPRGCILPGSGWDPSLISSCTTCGIEYVLLDKYLISSEYTDPDCGCNPVIIEDMGKTIYALPFDEELFAESDTTPEDVFKCLANIKDTSVLCAFLPLNKIQSMFSAPEGRLSWFDRFLKLAEENPGFAEFTLPGRVMKNQAFFHKMFISSGASPKVNKWSLIPFSADDKQTDIRFLTRSSLRRFLLLYPEALNIYSRMMYTHFLVNQIRGDRARKKFAREELWRAQNCNAYWFLGSDGVCNPAIRQKTYKSLIQAEKIARESQNFMDAIISFDFDSDSLKEYICQFSAYNAFVRQRGGFIFELDLFLSPWNYADVMSRTIEYDGVTDTWPRKLFVDHLVDDADFNSLMEKTPETLPSTVFPSLLYYETAFDRVRHEISLKTSGIFGNLNQPVALRKNYIFSNNSIQVQYILKNESPLPLSGNFAVEFNLAFSGETPKEQKIEVITGETKEAVPPSLLYRSDDSVSYVQFQDCIHGVQFAFEPNENAGISLMPLHINRPLYGKTGNIYQATSLYFFWKVDLVPGYEMEKTISFKIKAGNCSRKNTGKV